MIRFNNIMAEEVPAKTASADLYVELGDGVTLENSQLLEVIRNIQRELSHLRSNNGQLLKASEGQERMRRGLAKKSRHRTVEPEIEKSGKRGTESEPSRSGGESDRTYPINEKKKNQTELQVQFQKIKPPSFDGEKEEDIEAWLLNMTKYFQAYEFKRKLKAILAIY